MAYAIVTQDNCSHDAKVKMAGYQNLFECTRCHKFISAITPREVDSTAPQYLENSWEDDEWI